MSSIKIKNENLRYIKNILEEPSKFLDKNNYKGKPCISYAYKKYGFLENWQLALSKLNDVPENEKHFNELVIRDNSEVKPYFDIEYYIEQFDYSPEEVLIYIKNSLIEIFKKTWDVVLLQRDILVAQCHRLTPNGHKKSFHVIISTTSPMCVFKSNNEANWLANKLREFISDKFDPSIVDAGVYKKVQNFRLVGHMKEGEDEPLKKMNEERNDLDYLITNIDNNNKKILSTEEQSDSLWKNLMKLKGFHKKTYTDYNIETITSFVKNAHPSCYFEKIDNHGFLQFNYSDRTEKCFTGEYHEKIGFFAFIKDSQILIGCHSGKCVESINERDVKKTKIIGRIVEKECVKEINPVNKDEEFEMDYPFVTKCVFDKSLGMARLFKRLYTEPVRLKYTTEQKLYYWDGELWTEDESMFLNSLLAEVLVKMLRKYVNSLFEEVQDICVIDPDYEGEDNDLKKIAEVTRFIINRLLEGANLKAILNFVIPDITDKRFLKDKDIHPYFIACKNGLVDLRTNKIRNFLPEDNITRRLEVSYNPEADCSDFEKFVRDITNNSEDMYNYLRWAIGYALQGKPNRKIYFILWGERGYNGKSLLLNTISEILSDYCKSMDSSVVLISPKKTAGSHSTELMQLENVRLGILSDLNKDAVINDGQIKQITGATDKISAREIHGKQREFTPTFVPFISTNHRPIINSSDEGLFDRTMIIPFEISFVENPQTKWEKKSDPDLYDKFKKNKEGILKWLIDCAIFYNNNLEHPVPEKITITKNEYKRDMNIHKRFIEEMFVLTDNEEDVISDKEVFGDFKIYCEVNQYSDGRKDKARVLHELQKCLEYTKTKSKIEFVKIKRRTDI